MVNAEQARPSLRVLSWNLLRGGTERRLPAICRTIAKNRPDVILLQEATPEIITSLANALRFPHIIAPPVSEGVDSVGVISRYPASGTSYIYDTPASGRARPIAMSTVVDLTTWRVVLANVHLSFVSQVWTLGEAGRVPDQGQLLQIEAQRRELASIVRHLRNAADNSEALILAGDMNFTPSSDLDQFLLSSGLRNASTSPNCPTAYYPTKLNPLVRPNSPVELVLDYHFYNDKLELAYPSAVDDSAFNASDHAALVSEFTWNR